MFSLLICLLFYIFPFLRVERFIGLLGSVLIDEMYYAVHFSCRSGK